jgi:hypothetical protein
MGAYVHPGGYVNVEDARQALQVWRRVVARMPAAAWAEAQPLLDRVASVLANEDGRPLPELLAVIAADFNGFVDQGCPPEMLPSLIGMAAVRLADRPG